MVVLRACLVLVGSLLLLGEAFTTPPRDGLVPFPGMAIGLWEDTWFSGTWRQGIMAQEGTGQMSPTPKDRQAIPN